MQFSFVILRMSILSNLEIQVERSDMLEGGKEALEPIWKLCSSLARLLQGE